MFEKIIVYNQMMFLNRSEKVKVSSSYNAFWVDCSAHCVVAGRAEGDRGKDVLAQRVEYIHSPLITL